MWSISTTVTCTPESFTSEASNAPPAVSIRPQEWVKMSPGPWQSMSTSRGSSMTYGIVTSTNCSREELETFRYDTPYNTRHQNYNLLIVTSRNGTTGFLLSFFCPFLFPLRWRFQDHFWVSSSSTKITDLNLSTFFFTTMFLWAGRFAPAIEIQ